MDGEENVIFSNRLSLFNNAITDKHTQDFPGKDEFCRNIAT